MNKILKTLFVLSALAVFATVSAKEYAEEEGVLVLGDSDLGDAVKEFEHILVEFYAPWCGHCKRLAPEYVKAAALLKEEGSAVRLAKVDATEHPNSAEQYGIQGYPTLKFFINGEPIEYEGGRTDKEIVGWLRRKTQPSTLEIGSPKHLNDLIGTNDVVVVFFGGNDHEHFAHFEGASKRFDDAVFLYTTDASIRTEHNVPEGTNVLLLKKFDEGRNELAGSFDLATLVRFVEESKTPLVLPFDQAAAQRIFGEALPTVFLIYKKDEAGKKAEAIFAEAAQKLKGKILFSTADLEDEALGPKLAEFVGVDESEAPTIRLVVPHAEASPKKFKFEAELTADNLAQFHDDFVAGKLVPFLKSEEIPATNDQPVKVVVAKQFEEIVLDSTKDVLIEFYAPWCGHCKRLEPIWNELAAELASVQGLVIAKMDATANEVESVDISGFPTIKFYPANNKAEPLEYDGDRSKAGFLRYLKDKLTVEHNIQVPEETHDHSHEGHDHHHHHDHEGHDHHHHHDHEGHDHHHHHEGEGHKPDGEL